MPIYMTYPYFEPAIINFYWLNLITDHYDDMNNDRKITDLPNEVLDNVFVRLDARDLIAVVKSNSKLRTSAEPCQYRSVRLRMQPTILGLFRYACITTPKRTEFVHNLQLDVEIYEDNPGVTIPMLNAVQSIMTSLSNLQHVTLYVIEQDETRQAPILPLLAHL